MHIQAREYTRGRSTTFVRENTSMLATGQQCVNTSRTTGLVASYFQMPGILVALRIFKLLVT